MRKLTTSVLAVGALAGAVFTGSALAAGQPARATHGSSTPNVETRTRDRPAHGTRHESTRLDRSSRGDGSAHEVGTGGR